jgi:hypothetical protein
VSAENADNRASPPKRTYPAESQAPENEQVEDSVEKAGEAELDAMAAERVVENGNEPDQEDNCAFHLAGIIYFFDFFEF